MATATTSFCNDDQDFDMFDKHDDLEGTAENTQFTSTELSENNTNVDTNSSTLTNECPSDFPPTKAKNNGEFTDYFASQSSIAASSSANFDSTPSSSSAAFSFASDATSAAHRTSLNMMQSHLQSIRKHQQTSAAGTASSSGAAPALNPVMNLRSKRAVDAGEGGSAGHRFNPLTGKLERNSEGVGSGAGSVGGQSHLTHNLLDSARDHLSPRLLAGFSGFGGGGDTMMLSGGSGEMIELEIEDEYNPLCPNDYEVLVVKRREKRRRQEEQREQEKEREKEERRHANSKSGMCRRPDSSRGEEDEYDAERERNGRHHHHHHHNHHKSHHRHGANSDNDRDCHHHKSHHHHHHRSSGGSAAGKSSSISAGGAGGVAIAPPSFLLEQDNAAASNSTQDEVGGDASEEIRNAQAKYGVTSVAAEMMVKMGYKEGRGLGREGQGMSMALQVEKTSKRGGKIIHEKDILKTAPVSASSSSSLTTTMSSSSSTTAAGGADVICTSAAILAIGQNYGGGDEDETSSPIAGQQMPSDTNSNSIRSKVILLTNMVGRGEVDDELQHEVSDECQNFGKVLNCVIIELDNAAADEEAVRIFVEFDSEDSASKAKADFSQRFFGGRKVKCGFYNQDSFTNLELSESTL